MSRRRRAPPPRAPAINVFAEIELKDEDVKEEYKERVYDLEEEFTYEGLRSRIFIVDPKRPVDCLIDSSYGPVIGRLTANQVGVDPFGQEYMALQLVAIKSCGLSFFRYTFSTAVYKFAGKQKLCDLDVRPALPREIELLRERGRKFVKYGIGVSYVANTGKMMIQTFGGLAKFSGEGRVMIDPVSFLHFNPNYCSMKGSEVGASKDYGISVKGKSATSSSQTIPETSLHLCWPSLCGFSFKMKRWGEILVDNIEDISFREDAFDKLVMENGMKLLIKSLVENFGKGFTDVIAGKGGGCIFLLHGPPGVGKTLTAEGLAEYLHRPLYMVDVGELGITPTELETRLRQVLEVAEKWNAIVLIDEADIFLETRSKSDVLRNSLVGVFLRLLEYHNGVLFLTSNRVEELDAAFQSRISVSLRYGDLEKSSRMKIWNNLLDSAEVKERDTEELATFDLNGRQIKTAIRLACSLAMAEKTDVTMEHIREAISMSRDFTSAAPSSKKEPAIEGALEPHALTG